MADNLKTNARYQTWIRMNKLLIFLLFSLLFILLAFLPINLYLRVLSGIIALPLIYITFIFLILITNSQHLGEIISQKYMT